MLANDEHGHADAVSSKKVARHLEGTVMIF
jgi:hypothetical protein